MSLYYLINSVLSTSDDLLTLSLYNTLHGRNYFPYFTDEETELKEPKEHSQDHQISKEQSQNSTWSGLGALDLSLLPFKGIWVFTNLLSLYWNLSI